MLDPATAPLLAAAVAALAIAAAAYAVLYPMFDGETAKEKRISTIAQTSVRKAAPRIDAATARRKQVADSLKEMEQRQKSNQKMTLRVALERAGFSSDPKPFWIASLLAGIACAGIAYVMLPQGRILLPLTALAAFVGVFGLPRFVLKKLIGRRQNKFIAELANAIDVIVRGVKTGLPINECIAIIANEAPVPVGPEFKEVVEQQRLGITLPDALNRMTQRVPLQEVRFLAIVIAIQQQSGGNLAEALNNLSSVLRDRHKMKMKVKALSSEAKASAAILGSLPPGVTIMLYLASPEYINPLFATTTGNFMIGLGLFWMSIGIFMMRKMINFKF